MTARAWPAKGIVAVSLNYRTNIFGFFVHPELTKESPHHASGNYGLLDQVAALQWVQKNIAAFGGDPKRVTIAGESAGSISVSALMASPLSRNLMAGAICESGAAIASLPPRPLAEAEQNGVKFAAAAGADSLAALRAMTAQQLQEAAAKAQGIRFSTAMDGYFLSKSLTEIALAGEQAKVPLLAGSNTEEQGPRAVLAGGEPTPETLAAAIRKFYGDKAEPVLKAYAATTTDEVFEAAMHLASARFISYGTWKWTELHMQTSGKPVYRYLYAKVRPAYLGMPGQPPPAAPAPWTRRRAAAAGTSRRGALRRDSVRHGQPGSRQALRVGARRLRRLEDHAGVLRELHQDGQPRRSGASALAGLQARDQLPAHADRRDVAGRAGTAPRPVSRAGCGHRTVGRPAGPIARHCARPGTGDANRQCRMHAVPRVPPFDRPATYDDLVGLPGGVVAEILDGELHASSCPALREAAAAVTLGRTPSPAARP